MGRKAKKVSYALPKVLLDRLELSIIDKPFSIHDFSEIITSLLWKNVIDKKHEFHILSKELRNRNKKERSHDLNSESERARSTPHTYLG